jgi:hypothetical protein
VLCLIYTGGPPPPLIWIASGSPPGQRSVPLHQQAPNRGPICSSGRPQHSLHRPGQLLAAAACDMTQPQSPVGGATTWQRAPDNASGATVPWLRPASAADSPAHCTAAMLCTRPWCPLPTRSNHTKPARCLLRLQKQHPPRHQSQRPAREAP